MVGDSRDKLKILFGQEKRVCEFKNAVKVHAEKATLIVKEISSAKEKTHFLPGTKVKVPLGKASPIEYSKVKMQIHLKTQNFAG